MSSAEGVMLRWVSIMLVAVVGGALAAPPPPGSEDAELMAPAGAWIRTQHTPEGAWCCDIADGRPAEVRQRSDGRWEVFYDRAKWEGGTDRWVLVPEAAVLPQASPIYVAIAWFFAGQVRCLALPRNS